MFKVELLFWVLELNQASVTPTKAPVSETTLKYQIVLNDTTNNYELKHILGGTKYVAGKKCRILRSNEAEILAATVATPAEFKEIASCPGYDTTHASECIIDCNSDKSVVPYNTFSPRTKYIYVKLGSDSSSSVNGNNHKKGGKVFGLVTPLLVNPKLKISVDNNKKLNLQVKTCTPVICPIHYKDAVFNNGTKKDSCDTESAATTLEFDLFIPHYEMRCENYPSFFYNMPNLYMKKNMAIYEPQYYVTKKLGADKQVVLKFQGSILSSEICVFSIKDGKNAGNSQSFESKCGNESGKCYALCKDIELTVTAAKEIYKILIQTRHNDLSKTSGVSFEGFQQDKFFITETGEGLISAPSKQGVSIDGKLLKPTTEGVTAFNSCTYKHYSANKIKPTASTSPSCSTGTSSSGTTCKTNCEKVEIEGLSAGKPYIIEIESGLNEPANFKEQLLILTEKSGDDKIFLATEPNKNEFQATLTAIGGNGETDKKNEPNCEYYISPSGKNTFYAARCTDINPCRGRCREPITITDLEPNTSYDIKVVSDKDYKYHVYSNVLTTSLTISQMYKNEGLELNAQLSKQTPEAICIYSIQMKKNDKFDDIYTCNIPQNQGTKLGVSKISNILKARFRNRVFRRTPHRIGFNFPRNRRISNNIFLRTGSRNGGVTATQTTSSVKKCTTIPLCSSIAFNDYDANEEYKISVTAVEKSSTKEITIKPTVQRTNPTEKGKTIYFDILRNENSIRVYSTLPHGLDDTSTCKWKLHNSGVKSMRIVKQCMSPADAGCETFPTCKSFTIDGVEDMNGYHLTVYSSKDDSIFGVNGINPGARSSSSSKTHIIIIVVSVIGVLIIGVIGFVVFKKKN